MSVSIYVRTNVVIIGYWRVMCVRSYILIQYIRTCLISIMHVFELYVGFDGELTVTIVTDPAGIPVDGQDNTYGYPILTNVNLTCMATTADGSPATVTSYRWNAINCYNTNDGVDEPCFYSQGETSQSIPNSFDVALRAQDAGTVNCTATIDGTDYTSDPLTLRISGELHTYKHTFIILLTRN